MELNLQTAVNPCHGGASILTWDVFELVKTEAICINTHKLFWLHQASLYIKTKSKTLSNKHYLLPPYLQKKRSVISNALRYPPPPNSPHSTFPFSPFSSLSTQRLNSISLSSASPSIPGSPFSHTAHLSVFLCTLSTFFLTHVDTEKYGCQRGRLNWCMKLK